MDFNKTRYEASHGDVCIFDFNMVAAIIIEIATCNHSYLNINYIS